jgi:biopolymer transport protein ExbD
MSFFDFNDEVHTPMAEINTTPLVDVMMVLLIIFIITAPLLTQALNVNLPQVAGQPEPRKPEEITVTINAQGQVYWNGQLVDTAALERQLAAAAQRDPQPILHLRADRNTAYQKLAEIMAEAQNAGITRLGFVIEPLSGPMKQSTQN